MVTGADEREDLWGYRKRLLFVLSVLRDAFPSQFPNSLRVLDIGCGNGSQLAIPLAREGLHVTGIDSDPASIAHAKELAREIPHASFKCASADDIVDRNFDVVILSEVLEHVEEPQQLLLAGANRLSKLGVAIVTTPNGYGEFEWDSWLFRGLRLQQAVDALASDKIEPLGSTDNHANGHVQFFTRRQLGEIFAACGLEVWRSRPATLFAGPFAGHLLARFERFIEWNARVTDRLPMAMASGWYFALRRRAMAGASA